MAWRTHFCYGTVRNGNIISFQFKIILIAKIQGADHQPMTPPPTSWKLRSRQTENFGSSSHTAAEMVMDSHEDLTWAGTEWVPGDASPDSSLLLWNLS